VNRRSKQLEQNGSDTTSILLREPGGTSFVIEEVGEMSGDEGNYGHDWEAILSELGAERKQSSTRGKP
jgi:hypothetical protein